MKTILVTLLLGSFLTPNLVYAQPNNGMQKPQINFEGTLQAFQGGMMRVMTKDGKPILFALPQSPNDLTFTAKMEPASLRQNMFIRLMDHVGADGESLSPIHSVVVFIPDKPKMNSNSNVTPVFRSQNFPGIYPLKDLRPPVPADRATNEVRIIGTFLELEKGTLSLQCGNIVKKVELTKEPSIEMHVHSLDFAQPGDTVTGVVAANVQSNQLIASNVSVFAAKPLALPPAPPVAAPKLRIKEKAK